MNQTIQALEWLAEWCEESSAPDIPEFSHPDWRQINAGIRSISKVPQSSDDYEVSVECEQVWCATFSWVCWLNTEEPQFDSHCVAAANTPEALALMLGWAPDSALTVGGGD